MRIFSCPFASLIVLTVILASLSAQAKPKIGDWSGMGFKFSYFCVRGG